MSPALPRAGRGERRDGGEIWPGRAASLHEGFELIPSILSV